MPPPEQGFRHLSDEVRLEGWRISIVSAEYEAPDGTRFHRDVVRHPGAVCVVPVTERDTVLLVRQYRPALERVTWELPGRAIGQAVWRMDRHLALIGRSPACKIRIVEPDVSKFHCSVVLTPHGQSPEPVQAAHRDFPENNPLAAPAVDGSPTPKPPSRPAHGPRPGL